ncbi:MAG TPA: EscU/YscU/HrcU family type III secretion system export apparatus switch protein [Limnobacter sp.]|uniref:EscU/YscU/HrcU family type III secretion system export apparatus switch protein n=1 Tax=Limnobacter sp. TaxID=2003368 RepID=UPI002ED83D38
MSGEKSEKPTPKKLRDARKKGQVVQSKDITAFAKILVGSSILFWGVDWALGRLGLLFDLLFLRNLRLNPAEIVDMFSAAFMETSLLMILFVFSCSIAAIASAWSQFGILFSTEAIKPSFKAFNAIGNIKNMFSKKSLQQILLQLVKVSIFFFVIYLILGDFLKDILWSFQSGLGMMLKLLREVLWKVVYVGMFIFLISSILDWVIQRQAHIKNLKMSKQDLKDEHKQMEGDPHIKSKRKEMHRSLLNSSLSRLSGASALVTNPTHIAVALSYQPGVHDIPFILAIETEENAAVLRKHARELKIPVIEHRPLARSIYEHCEVDQYILTEHLVMAAEVFKQVLKFNDSTPLTS